MTIININPYSIDEQKPQLTNVYNHLTNNNDDIILDNIKNEIIEINNLLKEDINNNTLKNNIKSNSTFIINEQTRRGCLNA